MRIIPDYKNLDIEGIPIIVYGRKIQNRKHKKKRINKKWIKRYGYKYINMQLWEEDKIYVIPGRDGKACLYMTIKAYEKLVSDPTIIKECKDLVKRVNNQR